MRRWRGALLCVFLLALMGNEQCPLGPQGTESSSTEPGVDIGGSSGAAWQVSYDENVIVTLRTGTQVASDTVVLGRQSVTLLDRVIQVGDFCWRTDTICPQHVLPQVTTILQPAESQVLLDFVRRGPLAGFSSDARLLGSLDGTELSVPLAVNGATGMCSLQPRSAILASALSLSDTESGESAAVLQGRTTVSYGGLCVASGTGSVLVTDEVELSIGFTAARAAAQ